MSFWRHLVERLPGVLGLKDGHGFALGHTASLPACEARRRGEQRRVAGGAGVADREVVCRKDAADAYAWWDALLAPPFHVTFHNYMGGAGDRTWTNMPAAKTGVFGNTTDRYVRRLDLTDARQVRFTFAIATGGVAGADLLLRYSTDNITYTDMTGTLTTFGASTGIFDSGWDDLDAGAKAGVYVRPYGQDGNGAADPVIDWLAAMFR